LGADIIQSSLSYKYFDAGQGDYGPNDIDGNTPIITRAADKAASKGMLVINGAGNDGTLTAPLSPHVGAPCDGDSVLCVGSVTSTNQYSSFSSRGPTADNRIKPDVVARGSGTNLIMPNGMVGLTNGTSLSTPLITSLAACLLQANPTPATCSFTMPLNGAPINSPIRTTSLAGAYPMPVKQIRS
jgi:subtilisin family serine protease